MGIEIIEPYESFVLAKISSEESHILKNGGFLVSPFKDSTKIELGALSFDTGFGEPQIDESLRISSYLPDVEGYFIVQFIGPIKDVW